MKKPVYTGGAKPVPGVTKVKGKEIFIGGKQQDGEWLYCGNKQWRRVGK